MEAHASQEAVGPPQAWWAEVVPVGIALCRQGRVEWANARLAEMAGRSRPEDLVGSALDALLEGGPGRETSAAPADAALECELRRPEGAPLRVRLRAASEPSATGRVLWVIEDVTALRAREAELLETGRVLREAQGQLAGLRERARREASEREEMLTVVSHELRTPVTVIAGYNRLLLSEQVGPLNDEQRRFLQESTRSCHRISAFVGNLLEATGRNAPCDTIAPCDADLDVTLRGVVSFLRPLLEPSRLRVEVEWDPDVPAVRFDPLRIEQVLTNLLGNAIKHSPPDGVITVAVAGRRAAGRDWVEVTVSDAGPGVAPEDRERIFEPYVQGGRGRRAGGLGLGLAICKRIIDAHGGATGVDGAPGQGSRFWFTLPVAPAEET